jgi:hypothetical protein
MFQILLLMYVKNLNVQNIQNFSVANCVCLFTHEYKSLICVKPKSVYEPHVLLILLCNPSHSVLTLPCRQRSLAVICHLMIRGSI